MLLELITDLSLTTVVGDLQPWLSNIVDWFVAGLAAFDFSDLAVGAAIYLVEKTLSRRRKLRPRRVQTGRRVLSERIYPTLSAR